MKNKIPAIYFVGFASLIVIAVLIFVLSGSKTSYGALDDFAKCLAAKSITMYGAYWCPHCQNEKKAFGSSFEYVPYVECTADPQACLKAEIEGYPTWITGDGRRFEGEQGLEKLSSISSCALPSESR